MTVEAALAALKKAMTDAGWVQYRLGWGHPDPGIPGVCVFSFMSAVQIQIDSDNKALPRKRHKPVGYIPATETDDGQKQTDPGAG